MDQLIDGGVATRSKFPFFLWYLSCGLGLWLGVFFHQLSTQLNLTVFASQISEHFSYSSAAIVAGVWFATMAMLGQAKGKLWLCLALTTLKALSQAYLFSTLFSLHPVEDVWNWLGILLVDVFLFWVGAYGLMASFWESPANWPPPKFCMSYVFWLLYFILCSCAKVWCLQSL